MRISRRIREPVRAFNDYAARPPSAWNRAILLLLAVALPVALWDKRGLAVGILGAVVYTPMFLVGVLHHQKMLAWSRDRRGSGGGSVGAAAVGALLFGVLGFLALALATDLSLATCGAVAAAGGAAFALFLVWRNRGVDASVPP